MVIILDDRTWSEHPVGTAVLPVVSSSGSAFASHSLLTVPGWTYGDLSSSKGSR